MIMMKPSWYITAVVYCRFPSRRYITYMYIHSYRHMCTQKIMIQFYKFVSCQTFQQFTNLFVFL